MRYISIQTTVSCNSLICRGADVNFPWFSVTFQFGGENTRLAHGDKTRNFLTKHTGNHRTSVDTKTELDFEKGIM
ncbi:hypothetical protein DPMN_139872 [Dreissena polymorpha]|uniref:Uncharacterized protein n=1 Tax=Dreissena polymorpha TaxID=45954 RepID=A0A9D4JL72_DREPO|nr:hypothetical protein DPMN_139872 [Dreissena polymorpha]